MVVESFSETACIDYYYLSLTKVLADENLFQERKVKIESFYSQKRVSQ